MVKKKKEYTDKNNPNLPDKIIQVNAIDQYMSDMARYSIYVLFDRFVPNFQDGLKPVQRRTLYCMWKDVKCHSLATKRKSANTTGTVIGMYHPHSSDSVYDTMKKMCNWFECKIPLIEYDSNSGSIQGGVQAASRYTESYLSKFAMDVLFADLEESLSVVDWHKTFDNHTLEPSALPVKIPLLLVNGNFGISIGERNESPSHSLNDVIDATINVMHNINAKVTLIPDHCQRCEIVDTDWDKISKLGFGFYTVRGIMETVVDGNEVYLSIRSTPNLVWANTVIEGIENLIKSGKLIQIKDIVDYTDKSNMDIRIYLKNGSDPEYVKQMIYKHTPLQNNARVNLRVIVHDGPILDIKHFSYKAYIIAFLNFRREVKFRLYNARLQKVETRIHAIDTYIKILESGHIEEIVHAIRNKTNTNEDALIEWLMKLLKITDLQAKFILNTQLKALSRSSLKSYKEEQKYLTDTVQKFITIITTPEMIDQEIEQELLDIKAKYGKPRQSILISESIASNIPSGEFQIIVYNNGFIRKIPLNEPIKNYKDMIPICGLVGDNSKDILIFDENGKVFKLPIYKIPLSAGTIRGVDIRLLLKRLSGNIISVLYLPLVEQLADKAEKYFLIIATRTGMIKRIDLDDIINSTTSGILYTKLVQTDTVSNVFIAGVKNDILLYTTNKVLRTNISNVPYVKRAALGNIGIKGESIRGMSILPHDCQYIVVITNSGKFARIPQNLINQSNTNRAGGKLIKLSKLDFILSLIACNDNNIIRCTQSTGQVVDIQASSIPIEEPIANGVQMTNNIVSVKAIKL